LSLHGKYKPIPGWINNCLDNLSRNWMWNHGVGNAFYKRRLKVFMFPMRAVAEAGTAEAESASRNPSSCCCEGHYCIDVDGDEFTATRIFLADNAIDLPLPPGSSWVNCHRLTTCQDIRSVSGILLVSFTTASPGSHPSRLWCLHRFGLGPSLFTTYSLVSTVTFRYARTLFFSHTLHIWQSLGLSRLSDRHRYVPVCICNRQPYSAVISGSPFVFPVCLAHTVRFPYA
jgi:hypothetical protein